jgi:hypothetical protein
MENGLPEADPPDEFDEYTLVLLYRGTNPPVLDDDESDRLQRRTGLDESRRLAESDPAVRRGRLKIVAFKWYTPKGVLKVQAD